MRRRVRLLIGTITLWCCIPAFAQKPKVVKVKPGFATVIVCPVQPELVTVGNPEQYSAQNAGRYILVKPLVNQGSTNMFIKAGNDSYNLFLQVSNTPDLEVRLLGRTQLPVNSNAVYNNGKPAQSASSTFNSAVKPNKAKDFSNLARGTKAVLASYLKTPRPYTYSVANSRVILAVDHMTMINDRFYIICTLVNESNIPYDIGYIRFKLIENARSYIFLKKKIKEEELEPSQETYKSRVLPNTSTRMLFAFEKHGFSSRSEIEIKCNEESGRRDLALKVPGSFLE